MFNNVEPFLMIILIPPMLSPESGKISLFTFLLEEQCSAGNAVLAVQCWQCSAGSACVRVASLCDFSVGFPTNKLIVQ